MEGKLREFLGTYKQLYEELCTCSEEIVHDKHEAESIVLKKLEEYFKKDLFSKGVEVRRSSLFVAVKNASIDHWRSENGRPQAIIDHDAAPLSPDHAIIISAVLGKVRAMVDQLPEPLRMVIGENFFNEKSMKEIAEEYHIPVPTLYQYRTKGIGMLREKFNQWGVSCKKAFEYFFGK